MVLETFLKLTVKSFSVSDKLVENSIEKCPIYLKNDLVLPLSDYEKATLEEIGDIDQFAMELHNKIEERKEK